MKCAIDAVIAGSRNAKRQRDNWKRRALAWQAELADCRACLRNIVEKVNASVSTPGGKPGYDLHECSADFLAGFAAAMQAVWDRLPLPEYGSDPMTPREISKLLSFVESHLPNAKSEVSE